MALYNGTGLQDIEWRRNDDGCELGRDRGTPELRAKKRAAWVNSSPSAPSLCPRPVPGGLDAGRVEAGLVVQDVARSGRVQHRAVSGSSPPSGAADRTMRNTSRSHQPACTASVVIKPPRPLHRAASHGPAIPAAIPKATPIRSASSKGRQNWPNTRTWRAAEATWTQTSWPRRAQRWHTVRTHATHVWQADRTRVESQLHARPMRELSGR